MASLALGVAGAFVGGFFGGPMGASIGWSLGSMLGSALDPVKIVGPKLSDLHLQGSSYGAAIPRLYGTARLGANVVWKTDLEPHEHKSGGKGGPETVTTTYSASYDAAICIGGKILSKIWANGRLVSENGTGDVPVVFYDGNANQRPDPTEESVVGAGLVPAYRGIARAVFTDQTLTDFGNALPQNNYLVSSGVHSLNRAATWTTIDPFSSDSRSNQRCVTLVDGVITIAFWRTNGSIPNYSSYAGPAWWRTETYDLDGTPIDVVEVEHSFGECEFRYCRNESTLSEILPTGGARYWMKDGAIVSGPINGGPFYDTSRSQFVYHNGYVYAVGGFAGYVSRFPAPDAVPSGTYDVNYLLGSSGDQFNIAVSNDGYIYVSGDQRLRKFDADLNLVKTWTSGASPHKFPIEADVPSGGSWMVCTDTYLVSAGGVYGLYQMTDTLPWPLLAFVPMISGATPIWNLGNGLCMTPDGILSVCEIGGPVTLASIVADICQRCGLTADQYDVSELVPVMVRGFVLDQTMTGRAAIETLMPVFFFDACESDGAIKFVRRGHASVVTIPATELAAHMDGEETPTPLQLVRAQDEELPAHITLNYINPDADYLTGSQQWRRMTGGSKIDSTVNVPVVLSDREAKAIVEAWGFNAWLERDKFAWSTSRAYAKYEPTDVVTINGIDLRITNKTEGAGGVINWEGRRAHIGVFAQGGGAGGSGGIVPGTVVTPQTTDLLLLDIPYIPDPTNIPAYWAAMAGSARRSWRGAVLDRSVDGGLTYAEIAGATSPDTIGVALTVLYAHRGGNTFDEANYVTVVIAPGGGELASATRDALINDAGTNLAMLGSEMIQYRDAVLIADHTYELRGLVRGRHMTEWAMESHFVGEHFATLPVATAVSGSYADIASPRKFKAVTSGQTLASATAVDFTNRGVILTPGSPVLLGAGVNGAGEWILQWVRRTRIGGRWLNFTDVPLSEASEQYLVTVWTDATYTVPVGTVTCGVPTTTITIAQQTTWFGAPQSALYWSVAQIGVMGPGYDSLGRAPTVVSPPPPDGPPTTPDVPLGDVQWHDDYRYPSTTHANKNFNFLQTTYSSSWAWAYMYQSFGGLRDLLVSDFGDEGNRIINVMGGMGRGYAPSGFMVPFGARIDPGPTLHAYRPLVDIALPYPDDRST